VNTTGQQKLHGRAAADSSLKSEGRYGRRERIEQLTLRIRRESKTHIALGANERALIRAANQRAEGQGFRGMFRERVWRTPQARAILLGCTMDDSVALLNAVTDEVRKAKAELEDLNNQAHGIADVVIPQMMSHVQKLRDARMAVTSEMTQSLTAMRDVRKFFLDQDHATEIARLERFVALCKEMQALKNAGVLDAVCDSALHLATGERA
jgi:hypothetical protein